MSIRKEMSLPIWMDLFGPEHKKNVYSHGYQHVSGRLYFPFTNDIDKVLIDLMTSDKKRTDMFTESHDGKHILFMGCSVTEPAAIPHEMGWAQKTYNAIKQKENVSGFYNLSIGGASIALEIILFFKYVTKYGIPDVVFFNMPGSARTISPHKPNYVLENNGIKRGGKMINSSITPKDEKEYPGSILMAEFFSFELYRAFHEYCKVANIKLISFSWSDFSGGWDPGITQTLFENKFDSFYSIINEDFKFFIEEYIKDENNKSDTLLIASDNVHPGEAEHAYYSHFALTAYNKLNNSLVLS